MEKVELEVIKREKVGTTNARNLRLKGFIPAVVYGKGSESISIAVENKKFKKIISSKAGKNVLITLKIDSNGKSQAVPVLTHEILYHPINDNIAHIDFYKIKMEEEIKTKVPVILVGESVGVKLDGGILVQGLRQVEIKCLPGDIPDKFEVNISELKIGNSVHVSDLKVAKGVVFLTLPTEILANIAAPSKEEEVAAPIVAPEVTGQAVPVATATGAQPAAGAPAGKEAAPKAPAKGAAPQAKAAASKEAGTQAKAPAAQAKAPAPESKKK